MQTYLQKLIDNDVIKNKLDINQTIKNGMAPIATLSNKDNQLLKADLLEQAKWNNWQTQAQKIVKQLKSNSIKFLVFKGFAYSWQLYNQSHIRPYSDIDIWVEKSDYVRFEKILENLSYQRHKSRQGRFVSFQNSFSDKRSPQTVIDVHWQISNRTEIHKTFIFKELYKISLKTKAKDYSFQALDKITAFIYACFHNMAHRPEHRKHIWHYDMALMWQQLDKIEKTAVIEQAKKQQLLDVVIEVLQKTNKIFPECLDVSIIDDIDEVQDNSSVYSQSRKRKIKDINNRLKNINGLVNKLHYLMEYVFQSTDYVSNRFKVKNNKWVYLYYPKMWLQDLIKLFK